jgi:hypothetical protein
MAISLLFLELHIAGMFVEHVKDMKNTTTTWTKQQSWQTDRETERAIIQCAS